MRSVASIRATARLAVSSAGLASSPRASLAAHAQRSTSITVSRRSLSFVKGDLRSTSTSSRAAADALAGQITAELMESMRFKIAATLETDPALVRVGDASGDGRHVEIDVVAAAFEGKKSMERQRMVYKAIWQELAETVHAVDAMTTKTPAEAGQ